MRALAVAAGEDAIECASLARGKDERKAFTSASGRGAGRPVVVKAAALILLHTPCQHGHFSHGFRRARRRRYR